MDVKKHKPQVCVIMPAFNSSEYIEEAIISVINQSVTDWELFVIDDGSSDHTREIVEGFVNKDSRIRLFTNQENMGVGRSRNRGLELCYGDYVALLDSDDYWEPQMLEKSIARAEETGADIIYCSYAIVDEQGRKLCNDFIVPEETDFQHSIVRNVISCSTALFTEKLAREMRFPTNIYHEDIALWFQLLRDGWVARGVPEILASYRQRSDSKTSNKLMSAVRRWPIYRRHLGLSVSQSMAAMVKYAYYGLIKFKKVR